MTFSKSLTISILAAFAILLPRTASAQTATGQLSITVLDASGALVPNANITIRGTDTGNIVRTITSNDHGLANAPLISAR